MDIYKETGKRLKEIRTKSNITQERLAELSGISSNFISQIERGRNKCSLETIHKLAIALNTPITNLINFKSSPVNSKDKYQKQIELLLKNLNDNDKNLVMEITKDVYGKLKKRK